MSDADDPRKRMGFVRKMVRDYDEHGKAFRRRESDEEFQDRIAAKLKAEPSALQPPPEPSRIAEAFGFRSGETQTGGPAKADTIIESGKIYGPNTPPSKGTVRVELCDGSTLVCEGRIVPGA